MYLYEFLRRGEYYAMMDLKLTRRKFDYKDFRYFITDQVYFNKTFLI